MRTRALTLTVLGAAAVLALSGCGPEDPLRVGVDTVEIDVVYGNQTNNEGDAPEPADPGAGDQGGGDQSAGDQGAGDSGAGDPGAGDPGAGEQGAGAPGAGDPNADAGSGAAEEAP